MKTPEVIFDLSKASFNQQPPFIFSNPGTGPQGQNTTQLRPYSAALSQSWGILKKKFWKLFGIELFSYIPTFALAIIFLLYGLAQFGFNYKEKLAQDPGIFLNAFTVVLGLVSIIFLLAMIVFLFWGQSAKLLYLKHSDSGLTAKQSIKQAWEVWRGYAWASILYGLKMLLGIILLIVPGVVWYVKYLFTPYVAVFEREQGATGGEVLRRASTLINGYRWGIFARVLATGILLGVIQFGIQIILTLIQGGVALVGSKVTMVIVIGIFWIIAVIIGIGLKLFRTVYEYVLYEETHSIKSVNETATHHFSGWKKALIIFFILLATLIPIGILTALSFTALDRAKTKARDAKTLSTAYQIQTGLEMYRQSHNGYPAGTNLNLEKTYCLDYDNGFIISACTGGNSFRVPVPTGNNDTFDYTQTQNRQDYELTFSLELPSGRFSRGKQVATSQGILSVDSLVPYGDGFKVSNGANVTNQDQDNDGLLDFDEIMTWNTDPKNPDSDGDGYKDGEEVKNGYRPNGPGKINQETPSEQLVGSTSNQSIGDCIPDPQFSKSFQTLKKMISGTMQSARYTCPNDSDVIILIFDAGTRENTIVVSKEIGNIYEFARFTPYAKNQFVYASDSINSFAWGSGKYYVTVQYTSGANGSRIDQQSLEGVVDEYIKKYPPENIGIEPQ